MMTGELFLLAWRLKMISHWWGKSGAFQDLANMQISRRSKKRQLVFFQFRQQGL